LFADLDQEDEAAENTNQTAGGGQNAITKDEIF